MENIGFKAAKHKLPVGDNTKQLFHRYTWRQEHWKNKDGWRCHGIVEKEEEEKEWVPWQQKDFKDSLIEEKKNLKNYLASR